MRIYPFRWKLLSEKDKGFTLIEILTALSIGFVLIILMLRLLAFTVNLMNYSTTKDDLFYQGRSSLEYIDREIQRAYRVHPVESKHTSGEENLGFVLESEPTNTEIYTKFITYYLKNNELVRATKSALSFEKVGKINEGNNKIAKDIKMIHGSYFDGNRKIIRIQITTMDDKKYILEIFVGDKVYET